MACNAFWTAAHMEIPLLVVVANNRSYFNDVAHQEKMAVVRDRPVENKFIGQEMDHPPIHVVAIARAQGLSGEGPIETSEEMAAALIRGDAAVRAGMAHLIEARVHVGYADDARGEHTSGRKS